MTVDHWDVVVLGCGGMGSATLYHLAERGVRVCGIDPFEPGHDKGSSHGETRIIRKAYLEHPNYVPLLDRAYTLWDRLTEESGRDLFVRCGLLAMGDRNSHVMQGQAACYAACDLPHEVLDEGELRQCYPDIGIGRNWGAYYDPLGGFLRVEECVRQHAQKALDRGAMLYAGESMRRWSVDGAGVRIETDRRTLHADRIVLTLGPWAVAQLNLLGVNARVVRKVLFWYSGAGIQSYELGSLPCYLVGSGKGEDTFYGFPSIDSRGVKVAEHNIYLNDRVDDPRAVNRALAVNDEPIVRRFVDDFFPRLKARRTHHTVCMYTMTPDKHFVVDVHPEHPQVIVAAGFSGHGFKFASVMGEVLSDLALEGNTKQPIDFLRLHRFYGGTN